MSNVARGNTVMVTLLAALLVPRIQRMTGATLTLDDVAALVAGSATVWHGGCAVFERYFPPPTQIVGVADIHPTLPANPAQETK